MKNQSNGLASSLTKTQIFKVSIASFLVFLTFNLIAQPVGTNYKECLTKINQNFPKDTAKNYQYTLNIYGIPNNSIITDLDFALYFTSDYFNANALRLISPYGSEARLMTINSCPGTNGYNIFNYTFDDQAYDIATYNFTYDPITKVGVKVPANFTCSSIGLYNLDKYNIARMRSQGDHLKIFNDLIIRTNTPSQPLYIDPNQIDIINNSISGDNIEALILKLGLMPGKGLTLRYNSSNSLPIGGLKTGTYYTFDIINSNTIKLKLQNATKITSIELNSLHYFSWTPVWVLFFYNSTPLVKGNVNHASINIKYVPGPNIAGGDLDNIIGNQPENRENGLNNQNADLSSNIKVYPNPFSNLAKIQFDLANELIVDASIIDNSGKQIRNFKINGKTGINEIVIEASQLPAYGQYVLKLNAENYHKVIPILYIAD